MVSRPLASSIVALAFTCLVHGSGRSQIATAGAQHPETESLAEKTLTVDNVNLREFGKLYSYPVDGAVHARPLYLSDITIGAVPRNVLLVATTTAKVYAFDADRASAAPLWTRDFTRPPAVTPAASVHGAPRGADGTGPAAIQGTPVVDEATGALYLIARTNENGHSVQRLHALDVRTGSPRPGSGVRIAAAVPGHGADSRPSIASGTVVSFNAAAQSQRVPLWLTNGLVLVAWGSDDDDVAHHGWVMAFDARTLARVAIFCSTPDGTGGGIGPTGGPRVDATGNAYFVTGQGEWDGRRNFGNSVLKFDVRRSGMTVVEHSRRNESHSIAGAPLVWDARADGALLFRWAPDDMLKSYRVSGGDVAAQPYAHANLLSAGEAGTAIALSANGGTARTGVIWAALPDDVDRAAAETRSMLRAYDAETLTEIWTSEQDSARETVGTLSKFVPPLVANGRVYLATEDAGIAVYGLLTANPEQTSAADLTRTAVASLDGTSIGAAAATGAIGINFTGNHTTHMAPAETAGVIAKPNWNNAAGAARGTPLQLVDEWGALTSATVTWSAYGTWMMPITDAAGNRRMMKGYLDTSSTSNTTVTVAALPSASYDVYVYADGDNSTRDRPAAYTISGAGIASTTINLTDPANTNFSSTFTRANGSTGNYVKFTITGTGFTITATPLPSVTTTRRAPVNAIQIVPVTAPDFTLSATPASRNVTPGAWTSYAISVGAVNGFAGSVALRVTGLPADATASFSPASITGSGSATLRISASSTTPIGNFALTVTGTSGTVSRTARVTLSVVPPSAGSGAISINFVGNNTISMSATELAGVMPKTHWNNAAGATRSTPRALVDDRGGPTTATATWSAYRTWMTPIVDAPGNFRMMKGYLNTSNTSVTRVEVVGLPTATYDVYVYADGDNGGYARSGTYRISGPGFTASPVDLTDAANTNFSGTFVRAASSAGNYVTFRVTAGSFTVTATPTTTSGGLSLRAPVNGIQIIRASQAQVLLDPPLTVTGIGAGQGVEIRDGKAYLYGDSTTGIIREYDVVGGNSLSYTGRQIALTAGGQDIVPHPTGLTVASGLPTLLGNTVSGQGKILVVDWARALAAGTLDGAVLARVTDDLAVNGSRPEYVRVGTRWLVASADYGNVGNEVRLYDPERLKTATRTSEPGVLVYRFRSSPYVQTLHWLDGQGRLVLVQNQTSGQGWRLTVVDLARSIETGQEVITSRVDLSLQSELEGFHMVAPERGLFVTAASSSNVYFGTVRLF